jgi:hypothetical protein
VLLLPDEAATDRVSREIESIPEPLRGIPDWTQ